MDKRITESALRSRASPESFSRGQKLYRAGAVFDAFRRSDQLFGRCEGTGEAFYDLRIRLGDRGIREASCSCPYDYGGYCKHIVALALTWIHNPNSIAEQENIETLLEPLNRNELVRLIADLTEQNPDLYSRLELAVGAGSTKKASRRMGRPGKRASHEDYGQQVRRILRGLRGYAAADAYSMMGGMVDQLDVVRDAAEKFLAGGDPRSALAVLAALVKEISASYEEFDDSNGELGVFLDGITLPLVESILSADLNRSERLSLAGELRPAIDNLVDYGIDGLESILSVLERGGSEGDGTDTGQVGAQDPVIVDARLNILERAGRTEEFLALSLDAGFYRRYCLKQIESGAFREAIVVGCNKIREADDSLAVALSLRDAGRVPDALKVAEKGLSREGEKFSLAAWLGPVEEDRGRIRQARAAYRAAFAEEPSLELYEALHRLSRKDWGSLKPKLMDALRRMGERDMLADVYISEGEWDRAIDVADKAAQWDFTLVEKVADAVLPHRPDWVVEAARKQAEQLISKADSKYYPIAAGWLERMKTACEKTGKAAKWRSYLEKLKEKYPRRRSLLAELGKL
jgi:uncharacterized Zn finger protein